MVTMKKYLALLLATVMIVMMVPLGVFTATAAVDDAIEIWDGSYISNRNEFAGGNGSEENPWIIKTGAQLAYAIDMPADNGGNGIAGDGGKYFKLANDIYLNDVTDPRWYENEDNNAWLNADGKWGWHFNGHIDGNGHFVYGIWYPKSAQTGEGAKAYASGLIPRMIGGSVKNLGVRYSRIYSLLYAGGIVGQTAGAIMRTIDQCFVDETVFIKFTALPNTGAPENANGAAGGIVGYAAGGNDNGYTAISNCYSKANLEAHNGNRANGIVATAWGGYWSIENCYSVGFAPYYASNNNEFSSLTGAQQTFKNIYTDNWEARFPSYELYSYVDNASMKGEAAKTNMPGLDYENIFETVENGTPKLRVFRNLPGEDITVPFEVWDGTISTGYGGGAGTEQFPWLIKTGAQLARAIELGTDAGGKGGQGGAGGCYYAITKDIYLNDVSVENWQENEDNNAWMNAEGTWTWGVNIQLDGLGHNVYGIWYPNDAQSGQVSAYGNAAGLIPVLMAGTIKNLGVRYSYINAKLYAGGIVGRAASKSAKIIDQCFVDESVNVAFNAVPDVDADANGGAGGIVGYTANANGDDPWLTITNSYSKAFLKGHADTRTNGIIGTSWDFSWAIKNCYSVGYAPYYAPGGNEFSRAMGDVSVNIYTDARMASGQEIFTYVSSDLMKGDAAKEGMSALDYVNVFATVEDKTPQLKVFGDLSTELPGVTPPVIPPPAEEPIEIWDGSAITNRNQFAGGDGSEENPWIIENGKQLVYALDLGTDAEGRGIGGDGGKYFKITKDIYLNDVSDPEWYKNEDNNVWLNPNAKWNWGVNINLDGQGHTIYGIWYPEDAQSSGGTGYAPTAGLIPVLMQGTVKNIAVREARIVGKLYAGGIVGRAASNKIKLIDQCYVDDSVNVTFTAMPDVDADPNGGAGGIVGYVANTSGDTPWLTITNCYSKATLNAHSDTRTNGIIGTSWDYSWAIKNCYSVGYAPYYAPGGNEFSRAKGDVSVNVYTNAREAGNVEQFTYVESDLMKGENAKDSMSGLDFDSIYYLTTDNEPALRIFGVRSHDITGDGSLNAGDLIALRKCLFGFINCGIADINSDDVLDIRDLIRLKKILL